MASVLQVCGCKAIVFSPKEMRQGAEQEMSQRCLYLRMAKEVANGYKLLQYNVADNGMLELIGGTLETSLKIYQAGSHATLTTFQ